MPALKPDTFTPLEPGFFQCSEPLFSVIIPARNEEVYLPLCLRALAASSRPYRGRVEVILVANRCTDRTEDIAREAGCRIVQEDAKNLSIIRNAGVSAARASTVITVDADSFVSANMISAIDKALTEERIAGGAVVILPERYSLGILATMAMLMPLVIVFRISGGLFFFRKSAFEAIGGFDESRSSAEDIDFARRLRAYARSRRGKFKILWNAHIVSSCRKFDKFGDWYFVLHPILSWRLLKGKSQEEADRVWYDFER